MGKKWLILILVVTPQAKEGADVQKEQQNQANLMYLKKKYPVEVVEDPKVQWLKPPKSQRLLHLAKDEDVHQRKGQEKLKAMALRQLKRPKEKRRSQRRLKHLRKMAQKRMILPTKMNKDK